MLIASIGARTPYASVRSKAYPTLRILLNRSRNSIVCDKEWPGLSNDSFRTLPKWLDEDARYLIPDEERADFAKLKTDPQRDKFIADFWERRNPNPGSEPNNFKEEHYRRLAYANESFAADIPGWRTDRGRIYIVYGPPDEREQHPGHTDIEPLPSDIWRYKILYGIGWNVVFKFIDTCRCGQYQLSEDPTKKQPRKTDEMYLRTTYADQHFTANIPGWKTDRGRTYIRYGAPDWIDQHFSDGGSQGASDVVGDGTAPYDWQRWHYRYIEDIGEDLIIDFVDTCACGQFRIPIARSDLNKYKPHSPIQHISGRQ